MKTIGMRRLSFNPRHALWAIFLLSPFGYWLGRRIDLDLWFDELSSLSFFTFVPPWVTVLRYDDVGNHIFFNLLDNLFTLPFRLGLGLQLGTLLRHPWLIRLVPLAYTLAIFAVLYRIAVRFLAREAAPLVVVLLATSIPFYNFCLQIRGYILSMLLLSLLLYFSWSGKRRRDRIGILVCAALLVYTIPTNALLLGGVGVAGLAAMARASAQARTNRWLQLRSLATGTVLGFLGYVPPLLFRLPGRSNRLVDHFSRGWDFEPRAFSVVLPGTVKAFIADQWLLVAGLILACLVVLLSRSDAMLRLRGRFAWLTTALLTPFVLFYLLGIGDLGTARILSVATPLFVLWFATALTLVYQGIPLLRRAPRVLLVALFVYCNVIFWLNVDLMDRRALVDIARGTSSQELAQNFYQSRYCLSDTLTQLQDRLRRDPLPVILYRHIGLGTEFYLREYGIPYRAQDWVDFRFAAFRAMLDGQPRAYVLTLYPNTFATDLRREMPEYRITRLNPRWDFHNLFLLERDDSKGPLPVQ